MRTKGKPAGSGGRREGAADAGEVGVRRATSLTRPAVPTRYSSTVRHGEYSAPADGQYTLTCKVPGDGFLDHALRAVQGHRREEPPVGDLRQTEGLAAHAD